MGKSGSVVTLFTDGSAVKGNPGLAAGAYVVVKDGKVLEALGVPIGTGTNNQGELTGALTGLVAAIGTHASKGDTLMVVSDSQYLLAGLQDTASYTGIGRPNRELWVKLANALKDATDKDVTVKCWWVKGHAQNNGNIVCDRLARKAARTQQYQTIDESVKSATGNAVPQAGRKGRGGKPVQKG